MDRIFISRPYVEGGHPPSNRGHEGFASGGRYIRAGPPNRLYGAQVPFGVKDAVISRHACLLVSGAAPSSSMGDETTPESHGQKDRFWNSRETFSRVGGGFEMDPEAWLSLWLRDREICMLHTGGTSRIGLVRD